MQISIVIVSFNTKELLEDCLNSVNAAAKNIQTETFVVDNNSHDGTQKSVRQNFPWVNLIANKTNIGFSKANNIALKKTSGKYILVLNPDTVLQKDTLSKMTNFMEKNQDVSMATCRVELPDGKLDLDARRRFPTPWRSFCHFSHLSRVFKKISFFSEYYMDDLPANREHEIDACAGAFMFIRASVLKKVGTFDEDYFFYGEDLDLCYRFRQQGYKIVYTPITKITHYKGASSGLKKHSKHLSKLSRDSKEKAIRESTRAMELFYKKHYQGKYPFFVTRPVLMAIDTLTLVRLARLK